jgi:hypothetical protein
VGVEFFNAGLLLLDGNEVGMELASKFPLAQIGSSDAHLLWMIGEGLTAFDGTSDQDFRRALLARNTKAMMSEPRSRLVLAGHWVSRIVMRYAGWVSINTSPQAPLQISRLAHEIQS